MIKDLYFSITETKFNNITGIAILKVLRYTNKLILLGILKKFSLKSFKICYYIIMHRRISERQTNQIKSLKTLTTLILQI